MRRIQVFDCIQLLFAHPSFISPVRKPTPNIIPQTFHREPTVILRRCISGKYSDYPERIGPKQMSRHYAMVRECCAILDVSEPELYAQQCSVNAYTSGHTHPFMIVETGLLEMIDDGEVMAVIPSSSQMTKTISCPTCKQMAEHGTKFCNSCGTPLATH